MLFTKIRINAQSHGDMICHPELKLKEIKAESESYFGCEWVMLRNGAMWEQHWHLLAAKKTSTVVGKPAGTSSSEVVFKTGLDGTLGNLTLCLNQWWASLPAVGFRTGNWMAFEVCLPRLSNLIPKIIPSDIAIRSQKATQSRDMEGASWIWLSCISLEQDSDYKPCYSGGWVVPAKKMVLSIFTFYTFQYYSAQIFLWYQ